MHQRRPLITGLVCVLLAARLLLAAGVARDGAAASGDFDNFWQIGSSTLRPYAEYRVEFTPLTVTLYKGLAPAAGNRRAFGAALVWIAVAADATTTAALVWAFGWIAALVYLLVTLPLIQFFYSRIDLLPTAAATVGFAAYERRWPAISAAGLVIGVALKLWPLPLAALLLRHRNPAGRRQGLATLALGLGAFVGTWLAVGGIRGILQVVTFRGASGWEIGSTGGSLVSLLSADRAFRYEAGAFRVGHISSEATIALLILGTEASLALAWIGARSGRIGATWLAAVGTLLAVSPLLSPQFMAWIAPGAAIAWIERSRAPALLAASAVVLTYVAMKTSADGWLAVRNLVLWGTAISAAVIVLRTSPRGDESRVFRC